MCKSSVMYIFAIYCKVCRVEIERSHISHELTYTRSDHGPNRLIIVDESIYSFKFSINFTSRAANSNTPMYNCAPRIIANGNKTLNQQQTDLLDPCLDWRLLNEPRWSLKQCNYSAINDQKMRSFICAFSIFIARIKFTILFNVLFFLLHKTVLLFLENTFAKIISYFSSCFA